MKAHRLIATALLISSFAVCANAQTDSPRKRLVEVNTAIQELDQKVEEINGQKRVLEDERRGLLDALAKDQIQQKYENPEGYLVANIDGNSDVTLLIDGKPRGIHLYGIYLKSKAESQQYLKRKLVSGVAYVRCTDQECYWVYLYDKKGGTSLNAQLVEQGFATTYDATSLDESKHVHDRANSSPLTQPSISQPSTSPVAAPSSSPGKPMPGTEVHVKGYTRKDGTYVAPHTRSAPRRKP